MRNWLLAAAVYWSRSPRRWCTRPQHKLSAWAAFAVEWAASTVEWVFQWFRAWASVVAFTPVS